jgi:hypothetical protein
VRFNRKGIKGTWQEGGVSTLVSARFARFARDFDLRLACARFDHVHVGAAASKEDDKEREEA